MNRRSFLLGSAGLAAAGVSALAFGQQGLPARRRPNVLLIMSDDQGSVDLGCYGAGDLRTPHLDALAARGVRFTQFYVAAAICSPSRGALMTGRYPQRNGLDTNAGGHIGLPPAEVTIAEAFREAGYRTGLFGKWHLGMEPEMSPNARGFDAFFGHKEGCIDNYSHFFYWGGPNRHDLWRNDERVREDGAFFPDLMTREACRFIDENRDEPFFLYLPTNIPHYPMQAEVEYDEAFAHLDQPRRRYAALVACMDDRIGRVLGKIDEHGLRDDTIVVFLSDNGHSVEERAFFGGGSAGPHRGHKFTFWEGGVRMPCIVSWPGVFPEGKVREQVASSMDWFPTLAACCGVPLPDRTFDGRDLRPVIGDASAPSPHAALHWQFQSQSAVREGDWKLTRNVPDTPLEGRIIPGEELFLANLADDPGERVNLAEAHPEIVERLTRLHETWLAEM
jgi:arylsulfatase A